MLLVLVSSQTGAQPPVFSGKTDRFTTRDGLPHNTITCLYQDHIGYLWIGTVNGLCRYDGIHFEPVQIPYDQDNPWQQVVQTLFEDREGILWLGTRSGRIISWNRNSKTWNQYGELDGQRGFVTHFYQDDKGKLWFGTITGQVGFYSYRHSSVSWKTQVNSHINALGLDSVGRLWVVKSSHLSVMDTAHFHEIPLPQNLTSRITQPENLELDASGRLLHWNDSACFLYHLRSHRFEQPHDLTKPLVWHAGKYVCTYPQAGAIYDRYLVDDQSGDYVINDVIVDQSGLIWVATDIGLVKIDRRRYQFHTYSTQEGSVVLDNNYVRALTLSGNDVWLGFKKGPITHLTYCPEKKKLCAKQNYEVLTVTGQVMTQMTINTLYVRQNGEVWCGGLEGFFQLNLEKSRFEPYLLTHAKGNSFAASEVWALGEDLKGRLWMGGKTIGLWLIDSQKHNQKVVVDPDTNVAIWKIYAAPSGTLWLGTDRGLYKITEVATNTFRVEPVRGLERYHIWDIKEDAQGRLFLATTNGGICIYNPKTSKWVHYGKEDGLPTNSVGGVELDSAGNGWFSTLNGLSRLDPTSGEIINYYEEDGLVSNDFNFSVSGQNPLGEMFFGTKNGLMSFHPQLNSQTPPTEAWVIFNSLQINGKEMIDSLGQAQHLQLDHSHNNLSLGFSLLEYSHPTKNLYRYRLSPFDPEWKYTSFRLPAATYTNLPPDDYTFVVEASPDGVHWQNSAAKLHLSVRPALWQRWWFTPALFGTVVALLSGLLHYRFRSNLRAEQQKNEVQQKMAALELKALQAQMNPHFIFNAVNSIQHFMLRGDLLAANDYLTRFARLMRFFLEASVNKRVKLSDELEMIQLYLELEALRFDAHFTFEIVCPPSVEADLRDIPTMLIQPYVENAVHHGLANSEKTDGHLKLKITADAQQLTLVIDDNGIGREAAMKLRDTLGQKPKSRAMQLMKERMEVHNLTGDEQIHIEVIDKKDATDRPLGTRVVITLTEKMPG